MIWFEISVLVCILIVLLYTIFTPRNRKVDSFYLTERKTHSSRKCGWDVSDSFTLTF